MSTKLEINKEILVSIKEATKIVSYSRDYLTKLAREKKIIATQIGRQWFIDMSSLQAFVQDVALEKNIRRQHLREDRKRERYAREELQLLNTDIKTKKSIFRFHSFAVSSIVLFLGLFTGNIIYTTVDITNNFASNDIKNSSLVAQVSVDEASLPGTLTQGTTHSNTVMEYPLFTNEEEVRVMNSEYEGVFLLSREGEVETAEQVANLFSDQVAVEFLDENTGLVKYKNDKGEVSEFPFVSVPRNTKYPSDINNQAP